MLKEEFVAIDKLRDKYLTPNAKQAGLTKANGWDLSALDNLKEENVSSLSLWWWERICLQNRLQTFKVNIGVTR